MDWSYVVSLAKELRTNGDPRWLDAPIEDLADELDDETSWQLSGLADELAADTLGAMVDDARTARVLGTWPLRQRSRLVEALVPAALGERRQLTAPSARQVGLLAANDGTRAGGLTDVPVERGAVRAWAERHGVADLLDFPASKVPGAGAMSYTVATVADLFAPARFIGRPVLPRVAEYAVALRERARPWLLAAAAERAVSRKAHAAYLARRRRPAFPSLRDAVASLEALRDRIGATIPAANRRQERQFPFRVAFVPRPTGLRVSVPRQLVPLIVTFHQGALGAYLSGGASPTKPQVYAAIEDAIDALCDPEGDAARAFDAYLATPTWRRVVEAATTKLTLAARAEPTGRLAFRLGGSGRRVHIDALLQSPRARGDFTAGKKVDPRRLVGEFPLSALETRILDDLIRLDELHFASDEEVARRVISAMTALADHPRVSTEIDGKSVPSAIRRGPLGISLIAAQGDVGHQVDFAVGGVRREAAEIAEAALPGGALLLRDEPARTYWLAHIDATTYALVAALAEMPATFPSDGIDALLDLLSRAEVEAELALPDDLLGETLDADTRPIVRLAPLGSGALSVALAVRPLSGGRTCEPGTGGERVLGVRDGVRVSARRRLDDERTRAEALLTKLPFAESDREGAFSLRVEDPDRAADLLVALHELGDELVVEWPEGAPLSIVGDVTRGDLRLRVERKRDWFNVEGEAEIAGHKVALSALLAAVRAGRRFVRVGQGRLVAIAKELREHLEVADDALFDGPRGLQATPHAFASLGDLVENDAQFRASKEFLAIQARVRRASTYEPPPPRLNAELRSYQVEGYRWLARLAEWGAGACLADDMGLGKTLQALALLVHRANEGPALVVAPTSVGPNWLREAERFAPSLELLAYRGPERRALLERLGPGMVLVTSYDLMARDAEPLASQRFATLVLDEAQALKNALAKRSAAARDLSADFCVALTGTPIENHLGELWSLMRVVAPGVLGSWDRFRERFAGPIERNRDPKRRAALARLLRPYLLRRTKRAVAPELPARIETQRLVVLSPAERALYEAERVLAIEALATAAGPEARFVVLAALTRLRQLACHPRMRDPASTIASSKLATFLELIAELREEGHRALVFSQFTTHLALVREVLDARGIRYQYLDGSTPAEQREGLVRTFQEGSDDLFLISLKAGGTGLNLTAADTVIHLDPWWNPATEDQATDRAHRIGQSRPVTVVRLISQATIEEAVVSLHAEKRDLAEGLLEGGELAAKLSTEDLAALIRAAARAGESAEEG